uniref:Uncharacterized protein n=1 Tax=Candidatus Kentrum sp. FW TaxID=2126338 RepID=A0A450SJW9_9GAMM|nr:MAG: hypothetical protein BECKFW1821A_GA0114235_104410 [Candidatus Kentron sp. FW]
MLPVILLVTNWGTHHRSPVHFLIQRNTDKRLVFRYARIIAWFDRLNVRISDRRYATAREKNMIQTQEIRETDGWRIHSKVLENRISIDLPDGFDLEEVEVIVLPIKRKMPTGNGIGQQGWEADFSAISQWDISEDDIRITSWQPPEF